MTFHDHFSGHADDYARYRPVYPEALFDWLARIAPDDARAWDCATGNGQAALALADRFAEVFATDASAEQIASATPHPRVEYAVQPAYDSGLPDDSMGLVTVGQALHWFDFASFFREVERVLEPGGVVAAWCYELFTITPEIDRPMLDLYRSLNADWPPERHHIETGYAEIPWPWPELEAPRFTMTADWSLEQTLGYLRTWSATRRHEERTGKDPVEAIEPALRRAWGNEATQTARWPLKIRASRLP